MGLLLETALVFSGLRGAGPGRGVPTRVKSGARGHLCFSFRHVYRVREGSGTPLQYSCLENPMDGGAWWAAVCGVAQSRTRLKRLSSSSSTEQLSLKRETDSRYTGPSGLQPEWLSEVTSQEGLSPQAHDDPSSAGPGTFAQGALPGIDRAAAALGWALITT